MSDDFKFWVQELKALAKSLQSDPPTSERDTRIEFYKHYKKSLYDDLDNLIYNIEKDISWPKADPKDYPIVSGRFYVDEIDHDQVEIVEPPSPHMEQADKGSVPLANLDDQVVIEYVAQQATTDPQFASRLKEAFAEAKHPPMELPTVAPRLWADNTEGLPATAFVAKYYAPWLEASVLTLKAIGDCDPALSNAYSKRASRHPDERLPLARAAGPRTIADPAAAIENYRTKGRERTARHRNRDKMANEPK